MLPPLVVFVVILWGSSGYIARMRDGIQDRGDPLLTAWILAWNQHQVIRDPLHLFDSNIFHPFSRTLAYSEHIFGPAMLAAPARLFTSNPVAVQNVSCITAFLMLGLVSYALFRRISGDPVAAVCGALLVTLSPVRFTALGHVQLLHTAGVPLMLYGLFAFFEQRRCWAAALTAAGLLFAILSSLYLAFMAAMALGLFLLLALTFSGKQALSSIRGLLPWLAAVALISVPFALPYWHLRNEFQFVRSLEGNELNWASHTFYLRPFPGSVGSKIAIALGFPPGGSLYLGLVTGILAVIGAAVLVHRHRARAGARFAALYLGLLAFVATVLSLGAWRTVSEGRLYLPWYWLHRLPGVDGIRAPVRFSVLVDIAVVGLAVMGLATIGRRFSGRWTPLLASSLVAGIGLLAFIERAPRLPIRLLERIEVGEAVPHVYRWLARDAPDARLIELPMGVGPGERESWDPVPYMQVHFSTYHWKRLVNGTSGYQPPGFALVAERVWQFPDPASLATLRLLSINRVVVRRDLYRRPIPSETLATNGFRILHDCPTDLVAEVPPPEIPAPLTLTPVLEVFPQTDDARRTVVAIRWKERLPEFMYPPAPVRMTVRVTDVEGREREVEEMRWLIEPSRQTYYSVRAMSSAESVSMEVSVRDGQRARVTWGLGGKEEDRRRVADCCPRNPEGGPSS